MTKQDLQKELLEKVKPGTKPSDLKKLKRSKSADNIPTPPPIPLNRSKSTEPSTFNDPKYPYTTLISQQQELEKLRKESEAKSTTISLLRKKVNELEQKGTHNDALLVELAQVYEELNKVKENAPSDSTELDNSLLARHQNLKSWFKQYQRTKQLDRELQENVNEASNELINQDKTISQLRTELSTLKLQKQSLTKDLELAQRAVAWRQSPFSPSPTENYLKPLLYSLALVIFIYYLLNARIEKT